MVILVLLAAQFLPRARDILDPSVLAPFWFVYALVVVRFVWLRVVGGEIGGYFDYTLPDVRVLLQLEFIVVAASLYCLLILAAWTLDSRARALMFAATAGLAATAVWAGWEYFGHRTAGATGSDPYAYVQMGIDFVTRGSPIHAFSLFPLFAESRIAWFPLVHLGYHLPFNSGGDAVSVWPPWGGVPYGLGYVIGGESALYLINPLFSLLSIAVSGLLAWELMRNESRTRRVVVTCLTCFVIATSNEIVDWAGVTMVDTQALVFSTLAFYCMLRAYRTGRWAWAIGAGLFWGLAYLVRHTQLVLVLGLLPLVLANVPRRARVINLLCLSLTALVVALPDLWYHHTYLGGWLTPESEELALYSPAAVVQSAATMWQSAFIGAEFGWLLLALVAGMVLYTRRERIPSAGLLLWLAAVLAVHLPYAALRLRDLIPEFPVLAFYSSYGVVASVGLLWQLRYRWAALTAAAVIFLALELGVTRVWNTLPRVVQDPPTRFGAMTVAQRAALDELKRLTPENALIGASLNSGAIELYAGRNTFRPDGWCGATDCAELREFLEVTAAQGHQIYLLEDDAALGPVLENLAPDHQIEKVTTLDVPLFGDTHIRNAGTLWRVSP